MEKKNIETFIKKYNLNGLVDQVRWVVKDKSLKVNAITSDKKFVSIVKMDNFEADDAEIGVLDSLKLKSMLGVIGDTMTLTPLLDERDPTRILSLVISDDKSEVSFMTADLDVLQKPPQMKQVPTFGVEIQLTDEFKEKFVKAKAALPDAELFTLTMGKKTKKLELVIGFSKNNSNKIALEVPTVDGKNTVKDPISFSAKNLKEILSANAEVKDPVFKVSENGLAFVEFNQDGFHSQYYMMKIDVED